MWIACGLMTKVIDRQINSRPKSEKESKVKSYIVKTNPQERLKKW
jgi:hypothetical protein